MVKTTINLDTEVYRMLVKEAVEKYGTTKTLSRLINDKLKRARTRGGADVVKRTAGLWCLKESGAAYTRRIRAESETRLKG
jgi:predicted CopG family antitoxin